MNQVKQLPLDQIEASADVQARAAMDDEAIEDYAEAFREQRELPPVVVYFDDQTNWLADGFHRLAAAKLLGWKRIKAEVRRGDQRDALLHSASSNTTHGLRRSNADKRRAVGILLADAEWSKWSSREIARRCGVSESFVRSVRESICAPCADAPGPRLVERDGQTYEMDTSNIGKANDLGQPNDAAGSDCGEPRSEPGNAEVVPVAVAEAVAVETGSSPPEPLPVAEPAPAVARPSGPPELVREVVHDALGRPVPDGLIEVFRNLTEFRSIMQLIGSVKRRVSDLTAGYRPGAECLRPNAQVVNADLDNAQKAIRFNAPYAVCPQCEGYRCKGKDSLCQGLGWLREDQYGRLSDQQKHGGEFPGQAA